jgi:hypothetical protein
MTGLCSSNAAFSSSRVTARTHLSGNFIIRPIAAAFAPPARDFLIPAAHALYVVLSGLLQFKKARQAELTLHALTPSRSAGNPLHSGKFSNAAQRRREDRGFPLPGGQPAPQSPRRRP